MSVAVNKLINEIEVADNDRPIVIIGTGPVGIRVAQNLLRENPQQPVVIYGNEPWEPYNRVRLSSFLAGELDWLGLTGSQLLPDSPNVTQVHNCEVVYIDRERRFVIDALERKQPYDKLIIATGSSPHIPSIPGIDTQHVYRFRNLADVEKLLARQVRSRSTVVIGGGVLGLEAARAMQRQNTRVMVVDHSSHLMSQQLNPEAAELLREQILAIGIKVQLGFGVAKIEADRDGKVNGIRLHNDKLIECDTVIVATGIKPNIELARNARLSIGRGIRVNDAMQTSDPCIYAVGGCAEHRGIVYGLVAPGYEQAGVVVHSLLDEASRYRGSTAVTRLKVVDIPLFSMGQANVVEDTGHFFREYIYHRPAARTYRKLVLKNGRLVGGLAIGQWQEIGRLQEAINNQRRIWPWQVQRFVQTGSLWPVQDNSGIAQWPASTTVCQCMGVTRGQLSKLIKEGNASVESVRARSGAASVCGGCKPLLAELVGEKPEADRIKGVKTVLAGSVLALLLTMLVSLLAPIPFQDSVVSGLSWDSLWRDKLIKQLSGYTILGIGLLGLLLSLRKRFKLFRLGEFSSWRVIHVLSGVLVVTGLIAHTGFRFGENLNLYLMINFIALMVAGAFAGGVVALQHRLDAARAVQLKRNLLWLHILLTWPLPVLLAFHVLQSYYF